MAQNITPLQQFTKIEKLINSLRFYESFLLLKKGISLFPNLYAVLEKLKRNESTYRYMLEYISDGNEDPSYRETIDSLKDTLYQGNDLLLRETLLKDSPDIYSSTRRMFNLRQTSLVSLIEDFKVSYLADNPEGVKDNFIISPLQDKNLNDIFTYIWTQALFEREDLEALNEIFDNEELPEYLKILSISAIILGNISYFNPKTFEFLLNQYESSSDLSIRSRSIMGVVLISLLYPHRVAYDIDLRSRLMLSQGDEDFSKHIEEVIINIIKTYDTNRIDNKMRNEVIPGLMKIKPEIIDKMRNMASDSEKFLSEGNPQWEDLLENSEIGDKIKEINDLQLEGADVMVTAFSQLKNFPFFNIIANWFLPFTPGFYEFDNPLMDKDLDNFEKIKNVMCDSDLNSFFLSLKSMPEGQRNLMLSNIKNQLKELNEVMTNSIGETEDQKITRKIKLSLQDIYRFFKFYRKKGDFKDPFGKPFIDSNFQPLLSVFDIKPSTLKIIAEFYFKNKYYQEAVGLFEMIDSLEPGDFNIWEKIGFCYERLQQFDKAVIWYRKAELVNPDNKWLIKKLALALKNADKPEEAIEYYNRALDSEPENYHLLMSAGHCLLSSGKYDDALQRFYHAQYLKPDKLDPQRAIAWCELLNGQFVKAKTQYEKILKEEGADNIDNLNLAHASLAAKDIKDAIKYYRTFVLNSENKDITNLVIAFRDDSELLKRIGVPTSQLRLIVDKIRYDLIS